MKLVDLKDFPPYNKDYVKGEEFVTWDYNNEL